MLTLAASNSFTGDCVSITAGTLSTSSDANLGASANGLTLNGGILQFTSTGNVAAVAAARTITLGASGGTIDTSGLGAGSGSRTSIAANITGTGPLTLNANGDTSDNGAGSNSYLDLTGTNNFVGGVTITSGVVLAVDASFGNTANAILTISGVGGPGRSNGLEMPPSPAPIVLSAAPGSRILHRELMAGTNS